MKQHILWLSFAAAAACGRAPKSPEASNLQAVTWTPLCQIEGENAVGSILISGGVAVGSASGVHTFTFYNDNGRAVDTYRTAVSRTFSGTGKKPIAKAPAPSNATICFFAPASIRI